MSVKIHRRALLRGMLGAAAVSVALPPLECFMNRNGTAYAGGTAFPRRFGVFFWGNGTLPDHWNPAGDGPTWELSSIMAPLAPVKSALTVVTGTRVATVNTAPHAAGPAGLLTGDQMRNDTFSRPTLDQVIAQAIGGDTRFRSLEVGVQRATSGLSHSGPNQMNPPETSPRALFNRLFGEGFRAPGEMSEPDPRLRLQRSVLDAVTGQASRLRDRLGADDRVRLDAHLESVRGLERQIQRIEENPPSLAACMRPGAPMEEFADVNGRPQMSAISHAISDLVAMALACDQTRVFFNMYSQSVNNTLFGTFPAGHHQLTHDEPGDQPQVQGILALIMQDMLYFLQALQRVREGDGTLLDHSLVLCTSDTSFGRTHSIDDYPILLAGSANGAVRSGIHYASRGENASKVSLSILQAMGVRATEFGVGPGRVTENLGAILT